MCKPHEEKARQSDNVTRIEMLHNKNATNSMTCKFKIKLSRGNVVCDALKCNPLLATKTLLSYPLSEVISLALYFSRALLYCTYFIKTRRHCKQTNKQQQLQQSTWDSCGDHDSLCHIKINHAKYPGKAPNRDHELNKEKKGNPNPFNLISTSSKWQCASISIGDLVTFSIRCTFQCLWSTLWSTLIKCTSWVKTKNEIVFVLPTF